MLAELALPKRPPYVLPGHWKRRVRATLAEDRSALQEAAAGVVRAQDPAVWHTFRKHLKRYRYTVELLGKARPVLLDLLGREAWLPSYRGRRMEQAWQAQEQARQKVRERLNAPNRHFEGRAAAVPTFRHGLHSGPQATQRPL